MLLYHDIFLRLHHEEYNDSNQCHVDNQEDDEGSDQAYHRRFEVSSVIIFGLPCYM